MLALTKATGDYAQVFVCVAVAIIIHVVAGLLLGPFEGIAFLLYAADAGLYGVEAEPLAAG